MTGLSERLVTRLVNSIASHAAEEGDFPAVVGVRAFILVLRKLILWAMLGDETNGGLAEVRRYLIGEILQTFAAELPPMTRAELLALADAHQQRVVTVGPAEQDALDVTTFRDAPRV